jgi:hypothetical protein
MAKRGNQGYGKTELVKGNVDKFSPLFWDLMDKYAKSKNKSDQKFFMQEFNKLQAKMIPQQLGGIGDEPIQITWQQSQSPTSLGSGRINSTTQVHAG